jgi:hypothetical protein
MGLFRGFAFGVPALPPRGNGGRARRRIARQASDLVGLLYRIMII